MYWGFGLEGIVGADDRRDAVDLALQTLGTAKGASILLVDDDNSADGLLDVRSHYATALANAGYTAVTVHDVAPGADGPSAAAMSAYNAVVWFTGDAFDPSLLTATDHANLITHLDSGGRLLLSGADANLGSEATTFVAGYLDVDWVSESRKSGPSSCERFG